MSLPEKAFVSFLVSVFLMFGIVILDYIGVFDISDNSAAMPNSVKAIAFAVVFLALFLLSFFLVNLKRGSSKKKKTAAGNRPGITRRRGGLLAAASSLSLSSAAGNDETFRHDVIYERNGVPYIKSDMINNDKNPGKLDSNFVKLVESVKSPLAPPVPRQQDKPDKAHQGR